VRSICRILDLSPTLEINNANDISEFCHLQREPVFITKNGVGDMVVMSVETYERQQALLTLYTKLVESEAEIANGDEGEDFFEVARKLRNGVHGKV